MNKLGSAVVAFGLALGVSSGSALAEGDAANGEKLYKRCKACHSIDEEKSMIGPHLIGVVGRPAASVEGFKYSKAMMDSGLSWDEATLDQWLANPKGFLAGTKMAYPGMKKEEDRADVIAFLKTK